jgi:NADPH:quinone reductase-like Zn-dependent oxidoreductase
MTKAGAQAGQNILITGIGGGVAITVLQFAVAIGCNVYVTSGSPDKIEKAKALGAKGGVVYKNAAWDKDLKPMLPKDRPFLDAIVDGAGGDIVSKGAKLLRPGGVISQYGMTVGPKMDWLMQAVLANIDLRGSTMGSHQEFRDMLAFVDKHKIRPVISATSKGLDNLDGLNGLFDIMREGRNFGKLVVEIEDGPSSRL